MKSGLAVKGAERYVAGDVERFDQKNSVFSRARWDNSLGNIIELKHPRSLDSPFLREFQSGYRPLILFHVP